MVRGKVLGVVGCVVLKDELAYVLSRDRSLKDIYLVNEEEGEYVANEWAHLLPEKRIHLIELEEMKLPAEQEGFSTLIWMKPAGPHDNSEELRNTVKSAAVNIKDHVSYLLLFFGLCRNALWHAERMGQEIGKSLMILVDGQNREVDDCFGANFGGKKAYLEGIKENRGTIFVTPGYAENWTRRQERKSVDKIVEQVENMRFVFERMEYSRVLKLDNGLGDPIKFDERVRGFAKIFNFSIDSRSCPLEVFTHSYDLAKQRLSRMESQEATTFSELDPNPLSSPQCPQSRLKGV